MNDSLLTSLQRLTGSREGCFEGAKAKVDIIVVCHEIRCAALAPGERVYLTFRVVGGRYDGEPIDIGDSFSLRAVPEDGILLMSVWTASYISEAPKPESGRSPEDAAGGGEKRACGELRIPIKDLSSKCDGALYHSWMMLDSPGLNDSVAAVGMLESPGANPGEAFAQALAQGPRQLMYPKACISICRKEDSGKEGQIMWDADAPRKERISRWGPLLRSQQQHVLMCAAQHLQGAQQQREQRQQAAQKLEQFEETAAEQQRELSELREKIRQQQQKQEEKGPGGSPGGGSAGTPSLQELQERGRRQLEESQLLAEGCQERAARRGREAEASLEVDKQRAAEASLRQEKAALEEELAKIGEEANNKIEAANVRIRALRQERDDAAREVEQKEGEVRQLKGTREKLSSDKEKLEDEKKALLAIVEDLHQTCISAGLQPRGRGSLDSITNGFSIR